MLWLFMIACVKFTQNQIYIILYIVAVLLEDILFLGLMLYFFQ